MSKPIKVALLGMRGIPANYGGFETFAEELTPRLVDRGLQLTVYGRSNTVHYQAPFYKGVRVQLLPTIAHKYLDTVVHTFLSTLHAALFQKFDVVLIVNAANAPFALISRLSGTKVVLNVDGIERLRKKWGRAGQLYYRLGEWLATRLPHEIISDAETIASYYQEQYHTTSNVIFYGADTNREPAGETLEKLGLKPARYVLYVTRLEPENNPDKVIRAYQQVTTDLPLVIVGDAPYSSQYKKQLSRLAADDPRVIMPGAIYGSGYRELISHACVYVQATEVGGTHPALIEAMAVGNCVLANRVPEHEEVLMNSGMFYKKNNIQHLAECLTELLSDSNKRARLSGLALQRVQKNYDWNCVTNKYLELFTRLAGRKSQCVDSVIGEQGDS